MIKDSQSDLQGEVRLDSLYWGVDSPEQFIVLLRTHEEEISETLAASPNTKILENFQNIVKSVVEEGNLKKSEEKISNDAPWFYKDCMKSKEELRLAGKNIQSNPRDTNLRKILTEKKK